MLKVLLGVKSEGASNMKDLLETSFLKNKMEVNLVVKSKKSIILEELNREMVKGEPYDVLVLQEYVEREPYEIRELDSITDRFNTLSIVLLLTNERAGTSYMESLFNLGIYGGIYQNDSTINKVVEICLKPRSKASAKVYYGIEKGLKYGVSSNVDILSREDLTYVFNRFRQMENEGKLYEAYLALYEKYTDLENIYLIKMMPDDIKGRLLELEVFKQFSFDNGLLEEKEEKKKLFGFFGKKKDETAVSKTKYENDKLPSLSQIKVDLTMAPVEMAKEEDESLGETMSIDEVKTKQSDDFKAYEEPKVSTKAQGKEDKEETDLEDETSNHPIRGISEKVKEDVSKITMPKLPSMKLQMPKVKDALQDKISESIPKNQPSQKTHVFGFIGTALGVGVTHTAMTAASYLNHLGFKVALIEKNTLPCFIGFIQTQNGVKSVDGIDFYRSDHQMKESIYLKGYDYILYDFGNMTFIGEEQDEFKALHKTEIFTEFLRCDGRFVLTGFKLWQEAGLEVLTKEAFSNMKWTMLSVMTNQKELGSFCRKNFKGVMGYSLPIHYDPFYRGSDVDSLYKKMLGV